MSEIRVYHNQDKNAFDLKINNRPDKLIAAIYHRERNKRRLNLREAEIYAKLFAAAPETKKQRDALLDALKELHDDLEVCPPELSFNIWQRLEAAIKKAEEK